jgi:deoxyribonuclease (pyrimidine dimer)
MTRINAGIEPNYLLDTHVFSEWRELKRIPNVIASGKAKGKPGLKFTLNTGHVCFFYNKLGYLQKRFQKLAHEMDKRNLSYDKAVHQSICELFGNLLLKVEDVHFDDSEATALLIERINERIDSMSDSKITYRKTKITKSEAKAMLSLTLTETRD